MRITGNDLLNSLSKEIQQIWLSVASISFAVRGFMMLLASSILMMEMTHLLQAFSFALFIPASAYLFNQFLADDDRVFGQTMIIIATTLGGVIGNVLGGSLLQHFGVWEMLIFGTGFAVLGALLTILGIRKYRRQETIVILLLSSIKYLDTSFINNI